VQDANRHLAKRRVYTARLPTADHRGRWITNTNVGTGEICWNLAYDLAVIKRMGWLKPLARWRALARAKRSADAIAGANAKVA
jgi:hypothetical protein